MNPHLPAGQPMPGGVGGMGPGGRGHADIGPLSSPGPHTGGGPRRRPQYTHQQHSYNHHNHAPVYYHNNTNNNSHMNPYASAYYPQAPPYYPTGAMPGGPHMPYNGYARSPPTMHQQYPPIVSSSMVQPPPPQHYPRPPPQQPSPALSTPPPYHMAQPPPPAPLPQTPTSRHSSQDLAAPSTPLTSQSEEVPPQPEIAVVSARTPFRPPLPWLSHPDVPFPVRTAKSRRRRRFMLNSTVELPANPPAGLENMEESQTEGSTVEPTFPETPTLKQPDVARPETPSTQELPSDGAQSTSPTTPTSVQTTQVLNANNVTPKQSKAGSKTAVPAVPAIPALPKQSPKELKITPVASQPTSEKGAAIDSTAADTTDDTNPAASAGPPETTVDPSPAPAVVLEKPKLWTGLFASRAAAAASNAQFSSADSGTNGTAAEASAAGGSNTAPGSFAQSNASSLAGTLRSFRVRRDQVVSFLEPRGLINTGNMCYMNSVLQVLIFSMPFYDFLSQVGQNAALSFKSETPLIDAMIMFMMEYKVIDKAYSADQLRKRLRSEELEQYGEPFTPEFVYDAIRKLPRFASMRRGHQQDAEEFLGFLLEGLHDECAKVMQRVPEASTSTSTAANSSVASPTATSPLNGGDSSAWLEVGRKQRAAVTRSSGEPVAASPIAKIFGGQLRSELRVQGLKDSVTLEPYQPLQLDIGSPQVRNIVDALKNLTRSETLHGDFGSPRGRDAVATKQVFIESMPPVLILHLKRFQFDAEGTGTVKIWKKVGYPLELEIPKEVFSRQKRNSMLAEGTGFPKYRLIAAVYHHGKNASGGHYTVDVRRQDGLEWIRLDDTIIRRVRSEDVAEGGVEEDASKPAWSDTKKDQVASGSVNRFEGIGDETADEEGWNKVSAPASGVKKWSSVVNGAPKAPKDNKQDNKVAYLLFYQRV